MKRNNTNRQALASAVPFAFSVAAIGCRKIWLLAIAALLIFLIIGATPLLRKRANLWMFLFVGISTLPVNAYGAYKIMELMDLRFFLQGILWWVVLFCLLFSLEQLVFGLAARLMFPRQAEPSRKDRGDNRAA